MAHCVLGLKNGRVRKCEADSSHEWLLTPWPQKPHFCSSTQCEGKPRMQLKRTPQKQLTMRFEPAAAVPGAVIAPQ